MSLKRKFETRENEVISQHNKKHTLDSDEEDSDDYESDLNESDVEGGEEGVDQIDGEVKITPFNMREELQEGHFDKDGHYHWNKNLEIKDNWLNNIDWVKVETDKNYLNPNKDKTSSDESSTLNKFDCPSAYAKLLEYMKPDETLQNTLQRLGKKRPKLSSVERLRRKKEGIIDTELETINKITELANNILSKTGNMDIYQETYEVIKCKLSNLPSSSKNTQQTDMYADDFEDRENTRFKSKSNNKESVAVANSNIVLWEFKWKQEDTELQGPFTTKVMHEWSKGDYFKSGVYVRKYGDTSNFYASNRIDFDLYL